MRLEVSDERVVGRVHDHRKQGHPAVVTPRDVSNRRTRWNARDRLAESFLDPPSEFSDFAPSARRLDVHHVVETVARRLPRPACLEQATVDVAETASGPLIGFKRGVDAAHGRGGRARWSVGWGAAVHLESMPLISYECKSC